MEIEKENAKVVYLFLNLIFIAWAIILIGVALLVKDNRDLSHSIDLKKEAIDKRVIEFFKG